MSTITSRKVVGIFVSTVFALHCTLGGEPGNGATSDSTTSTATTTASTSTSGSHKDSGKTAKDEGKAAKIYWLTEHVDAVTDSGVTGLPTGTKVTYVGPGKDGKLKVKTDDKVFVDVTKDQVTDDPNKAALLAQEQAQKMPARCRRAGLAKQQADALAAATQPPVLMLPAPVAQAPSSSSSGPLAGSSLDKGAYNVVTSPKPKPTPRPPQPTPQPRR